MHKQSWQKRPIICDVLSAYYEDSLNVSMCFEPLSPMDCLRWPYATLEYNSNDIIK